ncbi:Non-lysosomal glucosylceramidase [Orchesella cincta]|uniref:Non-lysosomal glucosylceramidase n=1 Tax=Orchesella cincta TaxID=48709 RepID=A0A1D2N8W2_ORCCI|nr:Non-lysosomal glucosylceramidase [Orchesella cincta]
MEGVATEDVNLNLEETQCFKQPPEYGWKVRMDHKFAERWTQNVKPRLRQIPDLLPLFIRLITGVPLGGIGSGSIGRGFKGEFCRYQMTPGRYQYNVVHANQFILTVMDDKGERLYHKVLSGTGAPAKGKLSSWDWSYNPADATYQGLYPRAWYTFQVPELDLKLVCKQISPVIPHNYEDSSLPSAVFVWDIQNNSNKNLSISLTFTFKNGDGSDADKKMKCSSQTFSSAINKLQVKGVALDHQICGNNTTYGIGCLEKPNQLVTCMNQFNLKTGADIWSKLAETGKLDKECCTFDIKRGEMAVAVCCQSLITANQNSSMVFCLTWDQPEIIFPNKSVIFKRYLVWDNAIESWQRSVVSDEKLPDWFKSAIFNELYFVSDGGTLWLDYDTLSLPKTVTQKDDIRAEVGRFAYLEAHEYRMYNTYDVHYYASVALAMLWPKLQLSLQYDMADAVNFEDTSRRTCLFDGVRCNRKDKDCVPHDVGDPCEEPYTKINSYLIHDISDWKDLNLKFVLQVFRDYKFTKDDVYLHDMLPICNKLMKKSLQWDVDDDGMIENSGTADQTYDTWIMKGTSAYCGSLWLASLVSMIEMLKISKEYKGKDEDLSLYEKTLAKGKKSFHDKLWTGEYYKFDCSGSRKGDSIMSDQLSGHWWLSMCGIDDTEIFPKANVQKAVKTIFDKNVCCVMNGTMGAINGIHADGTIDTYTIQSEETWTGVAYTVASMLINEGMVEEGFKTAEGIYRTVYEKIGMGFETPEALHHSKTYRAIGYMRPLAIWSVLHAWESKRKQ